MNARSLAKALAQVLSVVGLLAVILSAVFTVTFTVLFFHRAGAPADVRVIQMMEYGFAGLIGASALTWFSVRTLRRLDSKVVRFQEASSPAYAHTAYLILFVAGLTFLIFLRARGGVLEKTLLVVVTAVALWLGIHLVVFLHELGHLLFGWLFRLELQKIQIGSGWLLLRRKMRSGFTWEWRWKPYGGVVIGWPADASPARLRRWFFVAGGPLASFGAAAIISALFRHAPFSIETNGRFVYSLTGVVVLMSTVGAAIGSLVPHSISFSGIKLQSDGHHLYKLLFPSREPPIELKWAMRWRQLSYLWTSGQKKRAWARLHEALEQDVELRKRLEFGKAWFHFCDEEFSEAIASFQTVLAEKSNPEFLRLSARAHLACCLAATARLEEARPLIKQVLRNAPAGLKPIYLDLFAWMPAIYEIRDWLDHGKRWNAEAIRLSPKSFGFRATEAALLVESGDVERGEEAVREVLRGNFTEADQGVAAFYLALILKRRGVPERQIARWRKRAVDWCPQAWLLRRAARDFEVDARSNAVVEQAA